MIETFLMERMQSTYENVVDFDLSESGVRPVTLREMVKYGFDLDALMDSPLGYSQSNGTIELRERISALYPGSTINHVEVTNGTSEANYILALTLLRAGDIVALQIPNYLQLWGVPRSLGATVERFELERVDGTWEIDWTAFERAVTPKTRFVYITNPNNPTGSVLSRKAMERIVKRIDEVGAYLIADEVYQGAEVEGERTPSFWGMSDRVIVTSGLSKAYGIPGVRIGWMVGPPEIIASCWTQHDYITICPNKISDHIARVAVSPDVRASLYARTRTVLRENLPILQEWAAEMGDFFEYTPPTAGAIVFMKYNSDAPSIPLAERILKEQSTLIVAGLQCGLEGYMRVWLGSRPEYLRDGLARLRTGLAPLIGVGV
ncbi:MAG: aminotransferase class I/II-fold pyridoxal phosphate-dependent enzyme [Gemmatimonadota bacterium]|nr:aminotransferase class I/II-fold pyridoxal phosphate-dependent enzyme [Gemmatimonadota bacterium]